MSILPYSDIDVGMYDLRTIYTGCQAGEPLLTVDIKKFTAPGARSRFAAFRQDEGPEADPTVLDVLVHQH